MNVFKKCLPHLYVVIAFVGIALFYFYPVLQGKKIDQSDIAQYNAMAKEQNDFRKEYKEEPFWTNSAFGGMPTYQLGAQYPHNYIKKLDGIIRFLPRPADYLFIYFLGFYILLLSVKIDYIKSFIGALFFGFSTYLIVILGVGHNAKAHAIAYMPLVVAGILLLFREKYVVGFLVLLLGSALEIQANHFQMTYYLLFFCLIIIGYFYFKFAKEKKFKEIYKITGIFVLVGVLSLGLNATNLMATSEYTSFSTRGLNELSKTPEGEVIKDKTGMSYDYITEYSYGISESLNLLVPRLFGGSNSEKLGDKSNLYNLLLSQGAPESTAIEFSENAPTYWGDQPIVAAPAYVGIIVFFLVILGLYSRRTILQCLFLAGAIFALLLSWGKNFPLLTDFFIKYVPLYNKFRAVSSIQVLLELAFPFLAILGLHYFIKSDKEKQFSILLKSSATILILLIILMLSKSLFSFSGGSDAFYAQAYGEIGPLFVDALKEDREAIFTEDLLRAIYFVLAVTIVLGLYVKSKVTMSKTIFLVGFIAVFDLFTVAKRYVNADDFVSQRKVEQPFEASEADKLIKEDTSHYRVFEPALGLSNARTSYFHKAIGGYSAVKPQRFQQLYDYQIANNNMEVLNMLNVKYIIKDSEEGQPIAFENPNKNGNAWFVSNLKMAKNTDEEMSLLSKFNSKKEAIINSKKFFSKGIKTDYKIDSTAKLNLLLYKPNYLKYKSINTNEGFGVFSEIYYPYGWKAYVNGKETPIYQVNYVLRGIQIPDGNNLIEFKFEPSVIKTGSKIALFTSILVLIVVVLITYKLIKEKE